MKRKNYGDIITLYERGKIRKETPKEVVDKLLETSDTLYKKYSTCPFIGNHSFNVGDRFMRPWTNNNAILTIVGLDYSSNEYVCLSSLFWCESYKPNIRVSFADDYRLQPVSCACPCCKVKFNVGDVVQFGCGHDKYPYLKIIEVDCRKEKYLVANLAVPSHHFYIPFDEKLTLACSAHSGAPCCKPCCKCGFTCAR